MSQVGQGNGDVWVDPSNLTGDIVVTTEDLLTSDSSMDELANSTPLDTEPVEFKDMVEVKFIKYFK